VSTGRHNVIARLDAGARETVLLEAHLDTVGVDNMVIDPFQPTIRDGKLYGRGSCDTKGSLAAFLFAVCDLVETNRMPTRNVVLAAVADEEYGFTGARYALEHGLEADFGIAGEPTSLRIVRAHKGVTRWKMSARGIAAHAAYPERGKNAIYTMSHLIPMLEEYAGTLQAGPSHPLLGPPTLNVGVVQGGSAVNIVPDRCTIEIDRRTIPGETLLSVLQPVTDMLQSMPDVTLEEPHLSVAGMEVSADSPAVTHLADAIRAVTGDCLTEAAHYATDAGMYNAGGIPSVVFGPGDIRQAHTDSEYVELQEFQQAIHITQNLLS
ncbi:MAG: M20 family metallopeptidase, partial [Bacteroidetes bacterium]|nr:M20 family metallopeptidase [Bacteroidota bacterium]